jgi:hypothetical protein
MDSTIGEYRESMDKISALIEDGVHIVHEYAHASTYHGLVHKKIYAEFATEEEAALFKLRM